MKLKILVVATLLLFAGCGPPSTAEDALRVCGSGNVESVDEDSDDFECQTDTVTVEEPETTTVP